MGVYELAVVSRRYGSDPEYILAGGGNTSFKDDASLYIKASGFPLATIEPEGFVRMDRAKLSQIWSAEYPQDDAEREARALEDLMAARLPGEESKRPSVETLVHEAHEDAYVVHTHPALVNGLTCSKGGAGRAAELFGDDVIWIPVVKPGYILARTVRRARSAYVAVHGRKPKAMLLQNHGIFISADTVEEIDALYREIFDILRGATTSLPDFTEAASSENTRGAVSEAIIGSFNRDVVLSYVYNRELISAMENETAFTPFSSAYTPDHIVYAGPKPLYVALTAGQDPGETVAAAIKSFVTAEGHEPKIVAVKDTGVFGVAESQAVADRAVTLFLDAVRIGVFSQSHGGHSFLPDDMIAFIVSWEVESYRNKVAGGTA